MAGPAAAQDGGSAGSARRRAMTALVLRRLSRFAAGRGIPAGREFLLDYDVIEAFCVTSWSSFSTWLKAAVCDMNWLGSVGLLGSW